jgi:hypothetical protein
MRKHSRFVRFCLGGLALVFLVAGLGGAAGADPGASDGSVSSGTSDALNGSTSSGCATAVNRSVSSGGVCDGAPARPTVVIEERRDGVRPTSAPAAPAAPVATPTPTRELAFTGSSMLPLVTLAGGLVALGMGLLLLSHRIRPKT